MRANALRQILLRVVPALLVPVALYCVAAEWAGLARLRLVGYDYAFFYYAFQTVLGHGATWSTMYDAHAQQAFLARLGYPFIPHNQYVYPPQFAYLLAPLGWLPFRLSFGLWAITSAMMYFCGVYWLIRLLWGYVSRPFFWLVLLAAALLTPFEFDLGVGNINSILFSLVSLTFYLLYHKHRERWAGLPLGLAIMFKVTPAAVLVMFLILRRWTTCVWTILCVAAGTAMTMLAAGPYTLWQYATHFTSFGRTSMGNGPAPYNQSIIGIMGLLQAHHWLMPSHALQTISFVLFASVTAYAIYRVVESPIRSDWRLDMAIASLSPLLFSPLVEQPHMVLALPALFVLWKIAAEAVDQERTSVRWMLAAVAAGCSLGMSLPATFVANLVVHRWPSWFLVQGRMFAVLTAVFVTVVWLHARSPRFGQRNLLQSTQEAYRA
ncbi:MAG: DUF2029 domain-containing protein [Alicyclobacillus macrosporangiidus]|uniref:glycosyltransferase family 87 protein n=1 Tax=Alicyclobacillus macrosporangiidus TaxID=392015 RepID=UPI0026F12B7C|nr:glycosyltransferase family 87 protein [Alicyclobacillus macrosporangiidus]MCL6600819.1 DUF2029 domain-containing protein [Alicyclobacillus macrosporangiidus]